MANPQEKKRLEKTSSKQQPRPFQRTRADHAQETAEDYVEAIADAIAEKGECRGADLARLFGVSHVTITKTVARLASEGLVESEPYRPLRLTTKGEKLASASRRRHEIVEQFLIALGVSPAIAAIDSEGIEHHVSEETLRVFKQYLEGVDNR
ncbi:manganese-binding transcriptional regulator MntR [Adhaeretor mobilis]|nr:manganese-binding transcriptional regulator MntR [Adhaeretor mobilis]